MEKNEKGYALLISLIIIILVIILFSSFTLGALNQRKSVEKTEENYEVTAIAEMGVEYYRAKILNDIENARLEIETLINAFKGIAEPTKEDILELDKQIKRVKTNLRENILKYKVTKDYSTAEKIIDSDRTVFFGLYSSPQFKDDLLEVKVKGYLDNRNGKERLITAKFNYPENLVVDETPDKDEDSSEDNILRVLPEPDFSKSVLSVFPPRGVPACNDDFKDNICFSNNLSNGKNFRNSTIYFTGNHVSKSGHNENFQQTTIYSKGKVRFDNMQKDSDVIYHINGEPEFGTIESGGDTFIQATNNGSFRNIYVKKILTINLKGFGTFSTIDSQKNIPDKKDGLLLYALGAEFQSINNLENSRFQIVGPTTFKQNASFINSQIHSTGKTNGVKLELKDNSRVYLDKGLNLTQDLVISNNSQIYLTGPIVIGQKLEVINSTLFLNGSTTQRQEFNVNNNSKVCIKNTSIDNLNIQDSNSKVHFLNINNQLKYNQNNRFRAIMYSDPTEFEKVCKYPSTGNLNIPDLKPIDGTYENGFIHAILYDK